MGYRPKPRQYPLKFADAEFAGLEVIMGSMSVAEWERLMAVADGAAAENDWRLELFAGRVISWNLTEGDDDQPVPVTLAALKALPRPFVAALFTAWQMALLGVDPTSAAGSSNGGSSGETAPPGMPQEPLTADDLAAMAASSPGSSGSMT